MRAVRAYIAGWKLLLRHGRMWLALYLFNLLLAGLAALPFSGYLSRTIGQSLELERNLEGFNYTFVNDFLREYGQGLAPILDAALGFVLLYLIVTALLTGGVLVAFRQFSEPFRWSVFWRGSTRFFWRLLRLTIYFLLLHAVLLGLFGGLYILATGGLDIFSMKTELELVQPLYILLPLYLLLAVLAFMIQDYAKIHIVQADEPWLTRPVLQAVGLVFRNLGPFLLLYFLNIASLALLFGIYWWVSPYLSGSSIGTIFLMVIWGQLFVFGRVGLRLLNLGSATYLYQQAVSDT